MRCALALVLLTLGACGGRRSAQTTPWPASRAAWRAALAGHTVAEAQPAPSLRYAPPVGCRLVYEWSAQLHTQMLEPVNTMPAMGLDLSGRAEGSATAQRWELRVPWLALAQLRGDERNPPVRDEGTLAPILLSTVGRSWQEQDGPTRSWAALGSFQGLVRFFPGLPEQTAVGSETLWRYLVHDRNAGLAVEVRRGRSTVPAGFALPATQTQARLARVRLARWLRIDGAHAALLEFDERTPTLSETAAMPGADAALTAQSSVTARGEALLLAPTGRLLWSQLEESADTRLGGMGVAQSHHQQLRAELRLVEACDGPVLSSPIAAPSLQERALSAVTRLRDALLAGDRARAAALLSPALTQRHGEGAVLDALVRHVTVHGPQSLGVPELLMDFSPRPPNGPLRFELHGRLAGLSGGPTTGTMVFECELVDGVARVRAITVDSVQGSTDHDVLELSPERLRTEAGGHPANTARPAASPRTPFTQ